jgi:hypothetical protein
MISKPENTQYIAKAPFLDGEAWIINVGFPLYIDPIFGRILYLYN